MENTDLIKQVKILRVHTGMDGRGTLAKIAKAIGAHKNAMSMAITGYRQTPGARELLLKAKEYLESEAS